MRATSWLIVLGCCCVETIALGQDAAVPASAPATTQPGITLVNLHLKQAVPEDVFFMLGKQGGIKFAPNGNVWDQEAMQVPNDVDFTNRPFWQAVHEVCGMWHVTLQNDFNSGRRLMVNAPQMSPNGQTWHALPTSESDGFVVEAVGFNQSINYGNPAGNSCGVQLRTYVDPSLRVQTFNGVAKVLEATDEAGHSMLLEHANGMFYGGGMQQRSFVFDCSVPLKYPPENAGKRIAHLKCILQLRAGDKMDSMVVEDPLKSPQVNKEFGDLRVTFRSLKKQGPSNYELKLTITHNDDDGRGGNNDWPMMQSAQLLDSSGHSFNNAGGGGGSSRNGVYNYTFNYNAPGGEDAPSGDPAKWVIELPTNTHVMRVPVEFSDLPML